MAKKSKGSKALARAQQKLARAQLALHVAQEKRAQAITRGEHEIERVRQHAAAREQKATTRVEKRAAGVARAEADLFTLTTKQGSSRRNGVSKPEAVGSATDSRVTIPARIEVDTPEASAELLTQEMPPADAGPIIVPDSVEVITGDDSEPLDSDTHNSSGSTW